MRRGKTSDTTTLRLERLLVPPDGVDDWLIADETLLAELRRRLPRRLPRGWRLRSLDCQALPLLDDLPPGLRCDQLNLSGTAIRSLPADLRVRTALDLHGCKRLTALPPGLRVARLNLRSCTALTTLPEGLRIGHLDLGNCRALTALPRDLRCGEIDLDGTALRALPPDLRVRHRLNLADCRQLVELPPGLSVRLLVLRGCTALAALPPGLDVFDLDLRGCTALTAWPGPARVRQGRLQLAGCSRLAALPADLEELECLDVSDCPRLTALPEGLRVRDWIDVGGSGLTGLPASLRGTPLRWHGVAIDERAAFHPELLTPEEVLQEPNAERRRVLTERYGLERLLRARAAEVLDADTDAGGRRELLRLPIEGEEALVCVAVQCPSTGRRYVLRVPPETQTCRHAVAWTAGFSDPERYSPLEET